MAAYDMIGQIALFAGAYTPRGWKRCDGSVLNIVEYRALFDIIGDTYGGNGTTTFALPNLGGRYMVCAQGVRPNLRPEAWSEILPPGEDSPVEYVQSVTYAQLMTLISGSDLVPGKQYLISDFAARWYAVDFNAGAFKRVSGSDQTGVTEPLLVVAATTSTLNKQCRSTLHLSDIIEYEPSSTGFLTDPFYSSASTIISAFKGVITRRIDCYYNVDVPFDWRNLTFRRWAVNPAAWSNATAYVVGNTVSHSNSLYVCIQNHTNQTPGSANTYWQKMLSANISTDPYWSYSAASFRCNVNGNSATCPVTASYVDYKVFNGYMVSNVRIGRGFTGRSALSNVFKQSSDFESGNFCVADGSSLNTISSGFTSNNIAYLFVGNCIGGYFTNNETIGDCLFNFILQSFNSNRVGTGFTGNCIGNSCSDNSFGQSFENSLIKDSFSSNSIGTGFNSVNYTAATLVYNTYGKTLSKSPDGTMWLSYISNAGALTIASHTT